MVNTTCWAVLVRAEKTRDCKKNGQWRLACGVSEVNRDSVRNGTGKNLVAFCPSTENLSGAEFKGCRPICLTEEFLKQQNIHIVS